MYLFFEEFAILSPVEKKSFYIKFNRKTNLIVGNKDSGKTTLARAMLYTLGCDVKNFELRNQLPNNIYILNFRIDDDRYVLIRKRLKSGKGKNYFKIYKNDYFSGVFYNTKDFTDYLNKIMSISLVTVDKEYNETKLYPNHIFLPFYTDQDNSWQNYLSSTFTNLAFIKDFKKLLLEYFVGARTNEFYDLKLEQHKLDNQVREKKALILSKELIYKENSQNIKIIENIDINDFKKQYYSVLEVYKNVISTEHELKRKINEMVYLRDSYLESKEMLTSNIDDFITHEIDNECPNCHQKMERDFSEDYLLFSTRENLINEREKIEMTLKENEEKLNKQLESLSDIKKDSVNLQQKLDSDSSVITLAERADSYALSRINLNLKDDLDSLNVELVKLQSDKKSVDTKLRKLKIKDLSNRYKELMNEYFDKLSIPFSLKPIYDTNFESVKILLSGTTKVQAFIAQYLTIQKMNQENKHVIKIPMMIDSYIKDHFNEVDTEITTKFIIDTLYESSHQSFVFITDSKQTLSYVDLTKVEKIEFSGVSNLLNQDYEQTYSKYSSFITGELD